MSIIESIFGAVDPMRPSTWWGPYWSRTTKSGENVSPESAMGLPTYFACLRVVSEDTAKIPIFAYRRLASRGKERLYNHVATRLLHDAPNDDMSAMAFRETLTHHALGWGGGVAEIERTRRGEPIALWPIHPSRVKIERDKSGALWYIIKSEDLSKPDTKIPAANILHIHGLGADGLQGYVLSVLAKESIGLGLASQGFGARFFGAGVNPSGVLEYPGKFKNADAIDDLRRQWAERYQGVDNSHKPLILEEGMKWQTVSIPPEEAQFLETRQFQVEDVCRWFRVPPNKVQHYLRAQGWSTVEGENTAYVVDTLTPWAIRWEQEIKRKLISESETDVLVEHVFDGLLRGDTQKRSTYYRQLFGIGVMSINDIREKENMNGIGPAGDVYYVPLNMTTAEAALKEPENTQESQGEDKPVPPEEDQGEDKAEQIKQAHLPVIADAISRVWAKADKAIPRAERRYEGNLNGMTMWREEFERKQGAYMVAALTPGSHALCDLLGRPCDTHRIETACAGLLPGGSPSVAAQEYINDLLELSGDSDG